MVNSSSVLFRPQQGLHFKPGRFADEACGMRLTPGYPEISGFLLTRGY